jgi:hypothetical protein
VIAACTSIGGQCAFPVHAFVDWRGHAVTDECAQHLNDGSLITREVLSNTPQRIDTTQARDQVFIGRLTKLADCLGVSVRGLRFAEARTLRVLLFAETLVCLPVGMSRLSERRRRTKRRDDGPKDSKYAGPRSCGCSRLSIR